MRARQLRQGIIVGVLLLVAVWLLSLIWGLAGKAQIAVTEANDAKGQYETLEKRRAMLQANISALETDRGRDAAIRTAFGVARAGEEVIVVVPPTPATTTASRSWLERFWDWLAR